MRTRSNITLCLLISVLTVASLGQIQRLIIPEANVTIGPGSSAVLSTLCTDYGIQGPSQNQAYRHVLTPIDSARVSIGGHEMSLDQAIQSNKVRLVTPSPTIDALVDERTHFNTLDPLHSIDPSKLRAELEHLPPAQRAARLARAQNPSTLRIVNLSGETLTFVARNAAVGTVDAPPPVIPVGATGQTRLWTAQIQQQLVKYGYNTPTDGEVGPATRAALLEFQKKHQLNQTGTPTEGVAQTLRRVDADNWIRSLPKGEYTVARLDDIGGEDVRYHLTASDGSVAYHGSLPDGLISALFALAKHSGDEGKSLYVEAPTLGEEDKANLVRSLRLATSDGRVVLMPSPEESLIFRESYFDRGANVSSIERESQIETVGPRKGWFHSVVNFLVSLPSGVRSVTVDFWTRTKAEMEIVLNSLRDNSDPAHAIQVSIADVVARSQDSLVAAGYSRRGLRAQLRDGTTRYWAEVHEILCITSVCRYDSAS